MSLTAPKTNPVIDWSIELELHREWMRSIASSRLGNLHAADDVVQDASLAVIQQSGRPSDPARIRSWLYKVIVRRCADFQRREISEEKRTMAWAERSCVDDQAGDGSDWVMISERQQLLRVAMEKLPEIERCMMQRKYGEGLGYRQLADEFEVSERVVEYRLRRARDFLRAELRLMNEGE